jgi:hypothetical protein
VTPSALQEAAEQHLKFLVDRGFRLVASEDVRVRYESDAVSVTLSAYPGEGGQVDLRVARLGHEAAVEVRTISGMFDPAKLSRGVAFLAERVQQEDAALRGDPTYFEQLTAEQQKLADAWTAYYERKGPRPQTGKLPP